MEENKKIKVSFKVLIALIIIVVIIGIAFAICILKNSLNENNGADKNNTVIKEESKEKIILYKGLDFSDGKNLNDDELELLDKAKVMGI